MAHLFGKITRYARGHTVCEDVAYTGKSSAGDHNTAPKCNKSDILFCNDFFQYMAQYVGQGKFYQCSKYFDCQPDRHSAVERL